MFLLRNYSIHVMIILGTKKISLSSLKSVPKFGVLIFAFEFLALSILSEIFHYNFRQPSIYL